MEGIFLRLCIKDENETIPFIKCHFARFFPSIHALKSFSKPLFHAEKHSYCIFNPFVRKWIQENSRFCTHSERKHQRILHRAEEWIFSSGSVEKQASDAIKGVFSTVFTGNMNTMIFFYYNHCSFKRAERRLRWPLSRKNENKKQKLRRNQ